VAKEMGVPNKTILKTIKSYRGLPFRLQHVGRIKETKIYNDSASTNPLSTVAAIEAFSGPTIMIIGGRDKNLDFRPIGKALQGSSIGLVIVYGESRLKIADSIKGKRPLKVIEGNLEEAFQAALVAANNVDNIVFSPGATSFDMFKDYEDRGHKFNGIVKKFAHRYTSQSKKMQP
jgi:UDP-N-acetylmuramoylalanine--D-glutamate ligase